MAGGGYELSSVTVHHLPSWTEGKNRNVRQASLDFESRLEPMICGTLRLVNSWRGLSFSKLRSVT